MVYDFIIVGSGLGGLISAAILSKEGHKVLVLEKNKQYGGNLQIFSRDKKIFDTGVHYIGGLAEGENLYSYFQYLDIYDDLKLKRLDLEGYDRVCFEGDPVEYKYSQGYDRFIDVMSSYFPEERENIVKFCEKVKNICDKFPMYKLEYSEGEYADLDDLNENARDVINSITKNEKLQKVLGGNNPLYAGEGDKTPFYVHALIFNHYTESAWRCVDGGAQIARLLIKKIKSYGGELKNHTEVEEFLFDGKLAKGVRAKDGKEYYGKNFISNVHPAITMDMIGEGMLRRSFTKRIKSLTNTAATFIVYIVLKPNKLPYFNYNIYHYIDQDVWYGINYKEQWPPGYALFPSATTKNSEYCDTLIAMSYMRFEEVEQWSESYNIISKPIDRGEAYEKFKKEKAELIIDELEKRFPDIRDWMQSYYTSTPLTNRDYIGSVDGSAYGIAKDYQNPLKSFISSKTKIPNLYLTGQNLNMHGILGVTISAINTCGAILGHRYLMGEIKKTLVHEPG